MNNSKKTLLGLILSAGLLGSMASAQAVGWCESGKPVKFAGLNWESGMLLTDVMHYEVSEGPETLAITIHTNGDPHWRAVEFASALIVRLLRFRLTPPPDPLSVALAFDNPAGQAAYERYFACPVEMNASSTTLVLPLTPYRTAPAGSEVARQFDPTFDAATIELRDSRAGNYLGVTITITATSREQLDDLYRALSSHPMVKVVL